MGWVGRGFLVGWWGCRGGGLLGGLGVGLGGRRGMLGGWRMRGGGGCRR